MSQIVATIFENDPAGMDRLMKGNRSYWLRRTRIIEGVGIRAKTIYRLDAFLGGKDGIPLPGAIGHCDLEQRFPK